MVIDIQHVKTRFRNIDCFTQLSAIPDKSVRIIFDDRPFDMTENDWEYKLSLEQITELWTQYLRILMDDGVIIFFTKQPFTTQIINSKPDLFRYEIIWIKEKPTLFFEKENRPLPVHENLLVFSKQYPHYYSVVFDDEMKGKAYQKIRSKEQASDNYNCDSKEVIITESSGERYPTTVVFFGRDHANKGIHPTQKPVGLYEWLIIRFSKPTEIILDTFCGSGSSIIASLKNNRQFLAFEKSLKIYTLSIQRIRYYLIHEKDNFKKPPKVSPNQQRLDAILKSL